MIYDGSRQVLPVHTPGHSRDHTVFLEKNNGRLFSGDLYLGDRIKYFRADERITDQIASIKKVLKYDFDALMCAHNPCVRNGRHHLQLKLNFLEDLYGEISALFSFGYSERAIIGVMKDREERKVKLISFGNVSFANIVRSCVREDMA